VVTVRRMGGRLACAVVATSDFAAARPAGLIAAKPLSEAAIRKSSESSEEGYNDDRTGN